MGWDAYASRTGKKIAKLTKKEHDAFRKAAKAVQKKAGYYDGYLPDGGLDTSNAATHLENATGENVYSEFGWDKEMVSVYAKTAIWDKHFVDEDRLGSFYSAKAFLETCAKLRLGIMFSY